MTIVLSDDRGGRFAPNPLITASGDSNLIISLNSGNSYTATITYTATQAGLATITALGIGANKITKTNQVFVSPYVIVIGYIGDSITQGVGGTPNAVQVATTVLGTGFTAVNRGVSGSTTKSWVNSLLAGAISEFQSNGIEVVSIMLGTNDSKVAENISIDDYKTNLETIIIQLKSAGIKKIILNEPPYIIPTGQWDATSITKMLGYIDAIDELIDGETVLRGDTQAYEYFEVNQGELPDKIHPNVLGHEHLGTFRATAIKSVLEYQINPDHHFVDTNSHTLQTTGNLTFRVDKYFGEFSNVVKVDNIQLTTGYTATSGSTNITLDSDYLNTLSAGDHTLMVGFEGGVRVSDTFTILPSPVTPPVTPPNTPSYG
ncbi:hypothetical protein FACS1894176_03560 [Bacteroidia bacterium]|nr:hypothetical protein FACS1894176_03560 [Bacteroidia bacterium]